MHAPCSDLDEEQDVERLQERRLDREEVAREDTRRLSLQEPAPANAPAGSRTDAAAAEQHRDTRSGNSDSELAQLAIDPQVSPPRVIPGHLQDQLADLR